MKKILLILLFIPIIFSCNNIDLTNPKYQSTSVINNQIEIGVTLDDFLLIAGERAEKTAAYRGGLTITYAIYQYDKNDEIIRYTLYDFYTFDGKVYKLTDYLTHYGSKTK